MKKITRMYEPWGYRDQNNYQGTETILENDLESFFAEVSYNKDDNKIHFANKDGVEKATLDVNEFVKSQAIVEKAWYENGNVHIKFTNGDEIVIDVKELLDETEFKDGLQVVEGQVSVLINTAESDEYISVGEAGIKLFGIKRDIEAEEARAISAETILDEKIDAETERAISAETALDDKIEKEIADRTADVDVEEVRAKGEETRINEKLDTEITRATRTEQELDSKITTVSTNLANETTRALAAEQELRTNLATEIANRKDDVDKEETRAKTAEEALDAKIYQEIADRTVDVNVEEARAISAETELQGAVEAEEQRASDAENALDIAKADKVDAVASAEYVKSNNIATINFKNINGDIISSIDATDFVVDGMVKDVKIENGNLIVTFNTDAGKQDINIPLAEIFDPSNYYTKSDIESKETVLQTGINDNATAIAAEEIRAISAETNLQNAIDLKADEETTYTKEEVDAIVKAKETEIYNLTKLVGEIGGNVTYTYPNELGTSLTSLLGNYGTVKLGEDATISRFGPGVTAKNKVTLNLNNHNLISTAASSYGAIMARGTQEITIGGKGTIDAGNGICIEANGANSIINLTGSTTVYQTDRSGGELIYCYAGTINISNGTFINNGTEKKFTLNCYDANYQNGTAKIIVTGGKFYDFNPADNSAEGEHTNFLAEGYHVEESQVTDEGITHTVYTVKKDS